jgi:hypothetical protein
MKKLTSDERFRLYEIRVTVRQLLQEDHFLTRDDKLLAEIDKARERINEIWNIMRQSYDKN